MSDGALPAGWYHGEGDPAGTHRYWDGAAWVGEPQLIEPAAGTAQQPATAGGWSDQAAAPAAQDKTPLQWMLEPYKRYADFKGRARRAEYWWFSLGQFLAVIALLILTAILGAISESLAGIGFILIVLFYLGTLIPSWAVYVRRMHDTDHSGWWILVPIVPLVFSFFDSGRGRNRFGESPKYPGY